MDNYSSLIEWFDKSGIIDNIRTHLRQNLVNALKGKELSLKSENDGPKSAKQYIHDLLIAEYLFDRNYAYALSVFASEAPLLVDFTKQLSTRTNHGEGKQRLSNEYVSHTLETLGIKSGTPEAQTVISRYSESEDPLLLCILHYLPSLSLRKCEDVKNEKEKMTRTQNLRKVETQTRNESSEERRLARAKMRLLNQKESFEADLKEKEEKLRQQVIIADQQLCLLQKKLKETQDSLGKIQEKEKLFQSQRIEQEERIHRREMELTLKEKFLSKEAERLEGERDSYRQFETDLQKLQDELAKVKREFPSNPNNMRDMHVQTDSESHTLLQRENAELSSLITQQQARIEELTLRSVRLSRQLEEVQLTRTNLMNITSSASKLKGDTLISDSSTEDLIKDAKLRLQRLEEQSSQAYMYYQNYITSS